MSDNKMPKQFWLSDLNVNTGIQEVRLAFTYSKNVKVTGNKIDVIEREPVLAQMDELVFALQLAKEFIEKHSVGFQGSALVAQEALADHKAWRKSLE